MQRRESAVTCKALKLDNDTFAIFCGGDDFGRYEYQASHTTLVAAVDDIVRYMRVRLMALGEPELSARKIMSETLERFNV